MDQGREPRSGQDLQPPRRDRARAARSRLRMGRLAGEHRAGRQDYRRRRGPAKLPRRVRGATRSDAATGMEGLSPRPPARLLRAVPWQGLCRRALRLRWQDVGRHHREPAALEARHRPRRGLRRRAPRQALRRQVLSGRVAATHGKAGRQPARRVPREHRDQRVDEPGDQKGGTGQACNLRAQDRLSKSLAQLRQSGDPAR